MLTLPSEVLIEDEALCDGLQNEKWTFFIEEKLHFIHGLEAHGVRRIQVGSFVHPKWVPQMADTALGGVGGCPFILAAAGNIATEDAAYTMAALGIRTGIDWQGLCGLALELEDLLGRTLPGRMAHIHKAV
jgi:isopropylmalate/homocitrate/citramalate synthase